MFVPIPHSFDLLGRAFVNARCAVIMRAAAAFAPSDVAFRQRRLASDLMVEAVAGLELWIAEAFPVRVTFVIDGVYALQPGEYRARAMHVEVLNGAVKIRGALC